MRPVLSKVSLDTYERSSRTSMGIAVPVVPSFLDLEQEETVAYDSAVSLPALLAEARRSVVAKEETGEPAPVLATTTSEIRPRNESFHTSPHFPEESHPNLAPIESNLHHVDTETITDSLVPSAPRLEVVHLRVGISSHPPESLPPALVQPRTRRRRSLSSKLLFGAIALAISFLVTTEISAIAHLPWLDPRPLFTKSVRAAKAKLPPLQLPRLPKL